MNHFPGHITSLFDTISKAAVDQNIHAFAFGNITRLGVTGNDRYLRDNEIQIVLSGNVNTPRLYEILSESITINKEIKHSKGQYSIVSDGLILQFNIKKSFDPSSIDDIKELSSFTIDAIFYNLRTSEIIDITGGISDLTSDSIIKSIHDTPWNIDIIFALSNRMGYFENANLHKDHTTEIKNISLRSFKEPLNSTFSEEIIELLVTPFPGNSFNFIIETFTDGQKWLTEHLLCLSSYFNIPINENINIDNILNPKVLELINIYNEFFLFNKIEPETSSERKNRIVTSLRLLFDSPEFNIPNPYIDKVSVMSAPESSATSSTVSAMGAKSGSVTLFGGPPGCEYGDCDPCIPEDCSTDSSEQCCCCHSYDIITQVNFQCHKQVIHSCDSTGTRPGPGLNQFAPGPVGDDDREACDAILGQGGYSPCSNLQGF